MAIDKEMYKRLGEEPPADEPEGDDQQQQQQQQQEPPADEPEGDDQQQQQQQNEAAPAPAMSDEDFLARLRALNPDIKSLDDIKKKDVPLDEETKKKQKNNAVLSFALKNELISRDDYDSYLVDSKKDSRQLVYEEYYNRRKAAGADDDKINREFARLYFEDSMDDDDAHLLAQRKADLEAEAKKIIKKKYPEVFTLEDKYDKHISDKVKEQTDNEKILSLTKTYTNDVNDIFTSAKFSVNIGDKDNPEEIDFVYPADIIDTVKKEFLRRETCSSFIANYDKTFLQDAINLRLQQLSQPKIIAHAAKTYHSRKMEHIKLGRKGAMQPDDIGNGGDNTIQRDEEMYRRVRED